MGENSIMDIQRQMHFLKDTNDHGEGITNFGDCVGIGSIYTIKTVPGSNLNRRLFYQSSAIIQIVSGLCRFLEFMQEEKWYPAGYGIIRGCRGTLQM
jgi:hypothetical protein